MKNSPATRGMDFCSIDAYIIFKTNIAKKTIKNLWTTFSRENLVDQYEGEVDKRSKSVGRELSANSKYVLVLVQKRSCKGLR